MSALWLHEPLTSMRLVAPCAPLPPFPPLPPFCGSSCTSIRKRSPPPFAPGADLAPLGNAGEVPGRYAPSNSAGTVFIPPPPCAAPRELPALSGVVLGRYSMSLRPRSGMVALSASLPPRPSRLCGAAGVFQRVPLCREFPRCEDVTRMTSCGDSCGSLWANAGGAAIPA